MSKKLQVTVVFEFNNVSDPNGELADAIVDELTMDCTRFEEAYNADCVFVADAEIVEENKA